MGRHFMAANAFQSHTPMKRAAMHNWHITARDSPVDHRTDTGELSVIPLLRAVRDGPITSATNAVQANVRVGIALRRD